VRSTGCCPFKSIGFLRNSEKSFAFSISTGEERCHVFLASQKGVPLCRAELAETGMPWKETMPSDQNSINQQKMSLSGLISNWSLWLPQPKPRSASHSHTVRFHLIRGRILLGLGQYERAISDFRSALRLDWRHEQAAAWLYKARCAVQHADKTGPLT
jgi:tetratricopeptide (TPR) repeat protein